MDNLDQPYIAPGPIFEPGLGWGGRLKKWSKKYILGGDCALCRATRYVLIFGLAVIVVAWPKFGNPTASLRPNLTIAEIVQPRDGKTQVARRILVKYFNQNGDPKPSAAEKVFLETILKDKISDQAVQQAGHKVELSYDEIEKAISQARLLSPLQLKKWETFSQRISF